MYIYQENMEIFAGRILLWEMFNIIGNDSLETTTKWVVDL
jgi:hypothetical protein